MGRRLGARMIVFVFFFTILTLIAGALGLL